MAVESEDGRAGPVRKVRKVREVPLAATICLVAIGVLFLVLAIFYFADPAPHLPALIPGHDAGLDRRRTKHGILAAVIAAAALLGAWLSTGSEDTRLTGGRKQDEDEDQDEA